ncbi:hypothetical protein OHA21_16330 [Actinoplanes sp. NBC_00393]|uniref:hypothetical protein n=1 Tax=Actinoplanes sp. NBC_00393 TaxID=2975953 RepID=UPI002E2004B0
MAAIVILALYAGGARDYLLILAGDTGYMSRQFGPDGVAYFTGYPLALRVVWTINIVGGLAAACLLLARSRWAVVAAVTSATAQVVLLVATFGFRDRWAALGAATSWFDLGIGVVAVLFAGYCRQLGRRGLLH